MAVKVPLVRDSTTNLPVEMSSADTISGVVYTTGTQTIAGDKTFTGNTQAINLNITGPFTGAGRVVVTANNTDTSSGSVITFNLKAGTGAGGNLSYAAPSYTGVPAFADALLLENIGAGGIALSAYGGAGLAFYAGTSRSLKWSVDANGSEVTNGSSTINCISGTDTFTVNTPGSSPAGSYISITSPGSNPGIVAQYSTTKRRDILFSNTGVQLAVSTNTGGTTPQYTFGENGYFNVSGSVLSGGTLRTTGSGISGFTGPGIEFYYYTDDTGNILCYDRSTAAYKPLYVRGSTVTLQASGTNVGVISTSGLTLGAGQNLSKITLSTAAPGTLVDGELYLQY